MAGRAPPRPQAARHARRPLRLLGRVTLRLRAPTRRDPASPRTPPVPIASTTVNERPAASELADSAEQAAPVARASRQGPRLCFLSYANFGNPPAKWMATIRDAVRLPGMRGVDFEYEGGMTPDVALNRDMNRQYPFSRLSG